MESAQHAQPTSIDLQQHDHNKQVASVQSTPSINLQQQVVPTAQLIQHVQPTSIVPQHTGGLVPSIEPQPNK